MQGEITANIDKSMLRVQKKQAVAEAKAGIKEAKAAFDAKFAEESKRYEALSADQKEAEKAKHEEILAELETERDNKLTILYAKRNSNSNFYSFVDNTFKHRAHVVLSLPTFLILFFIMYVPMVGLVLAFKTYKVSKGLFGSPWCGLANFKFLLASKDLFLNFTKNTLLYYVVFTSLGTLLNVSLAIAIDQFVLKRFAKTMQTILIIPVFISYAAVQFIVYAFIATDTGLINNLLGTRIRFYSEAKYWPYLVTIIKIWKDTGYGSVLYMSVLAGIDSELYEAADIDGANRWKKIWHITLPSLVPMITVMLLLSVGGVMHSDTGLFYQVTRNNGALYPTTQVVDSYVLNSIMHNPNFGYPGAASLYQSVVGLLLMLFANFTVRKIEPENALF